MRVNINKKVGNKLMLSDLNPKELFRKLAGYFFNIDNPIYTTKKNNPIEAVPHIGDITHHQDQSITFANFKPIKSNNKSDGKPIALLDLVLFDILKSFYYAGLRVAMAGIEPTLAGYDSATLTAELHCNMPQYTNYLYSFSNSFQI